MKRICFTILSVPSVPLPSFATLSFSSPSLYDPSVFLLSFASICFSLSILSVPSLPLLSFSALSFSLPFCQFLLYPSFHFLLSPFLYLFVSSFCTPPFIFSSLLFFTLLSVPSVPLLSFATLAFSPRDSKRRTESRLCGSSSVCGGPWVEISVRMLSSSFSWYYSALPGKSNLPTTMSFTSFPRLYLLTIQALPDLTQQFTFRNACTKSQFGMHVVSCVSKCKAVRLKRRNLSGGSRTALPPVLSPSSILPPPASRYPFITAWKNSVRVSKIVFQFVQFYQNLASLKLLGSLLQLGMLSPRVLK